MPRSLADEAEVVELPRTPLRPIDLEDFLTRDFPPRENLLTPWLAAKGLAMAYAPRGVGKTHFALGVADAVASGGSFLKWRAEKPRRVLLLDGEMPPAVLQERLANIAVHADTEPPSGFFKMLPYDLCEEGGPDLGSSEGQAQLEPHIRDADLLIVDNISTLCRTGKENEAEGWGVIQGSALRQRRQGRSVLFIHHAGKGGDQRGTSKREDVLDTVIRLSHPEDYEPTDGARFLVTFTKSPGIFGTDVEPFEARLSDGKWSCADTTDLLKAEVLALLAEGKSMRDVGRELGISKSKGRSHQKWRDAVSVRDLALAKLRQLEAGQQAGQMMGQELSHEPGSVQRPWDTANPQRTAENEQVSRCPTPIVPGQWDRGRGSGIGRETSGGTEAIGQRIAAARLREWWAHLSRLDPCQPRPGFSMGRWQTLYDASVWFVDAFGHPAARDGWSTGDIFGIEPRMERWGGLIDRLGDCRGPVMDADRASWTSSFYGAISCRTHQSAFT